MSAAVAAARIGDLGQERKQTPAQRFVHAAVGKSGLPPPRAILLPSQPQTVNSPAVNPPLPLSTPPPTPLFAGRSPPYIGREPDGRSPCSCPLAWSAWRSCFTGWSPLR